MKRRQTNRHGDKGGSAVACWLMALCAVLLAGAPVLGQDARLGTQAAVPTTAEADAESGAIVIGRTVYGAIDDNSDADVFQFWGLAGESVRIRLRATSGDLEPAVTLFLGPVPWVSGTEGPARGVTLDAATASAPQDLFGLGDVFVAVGGGQIRRFRPDGTLLQTLSVNNLQEDIGGMVFDGAGNLYAVGFQANTVYKFDNRGQYLGAFGSGYNAGPESIVLDRFGQFYVGQNDGTQQVLKFDRAGNLLDSYAPATERRGSDQLDLASDQKTLYYTSEGNNVLRYDLVARSQLANFNQQPLPSFAYALRILADGGVLVATDPMIVRLDDLGQVRQTYDAPLEDEWFTLNLDPGGDSFWSANYTTGRVYRFDLESGRVLTSWPAGVQTVLGGVVVYGEATAARPIPYEAIHDEYIATEAQAATAERTATIELAPLPFTGTYAVLVASTNSASSGGYELLVEPVDGDSNRAAVQHGGYARLADTETGRWFGQYGTFLAFSPDGETAAVQQQNYAHLISADTGQEIGQFGAFLEFSPDGKIAAVQHGGYARLIQCATGQEIGQFGGFEAFSPDGRTAAVQQGSYVHLIEAATGQEIGQYGLFFGFSPDGKTAAVQNQGYARLVKIDTGQQLGQYGAFVGFSPDGETAAMQQGQYVHLVRTATGGEVGQFGAFVAFSADGRTAAVQHEGYARLIDTRTGQEIGQFGAFYGFAPDGETAAVQHVGYARLINLRTGQQTGQFGALVGFSPDGETVAVQHEEYVRLINTRTGQELGQFGRFVAFAPDGRTAAVQHGAYVRLIKTPSGQELGDFGAFFSFSPDGRMAAVQHGGYLRLINTRTGQQFGQYGSFPAFSPDGETTAAQQGNYIRPVDTRTGLEFGQFGAFVAFSLDGDTIAVQDGGYVRLVKTTTGRVYGNFGQFAAFSYDRVSRRGPASAVVDPAQAATLTHTDAEGLQITLQFPPGAVDERTTVVLTPVAWSSYGPDLAFAKRAFELSAYQAGVLQDDFAFGAPVVVTIQYSDDDVRAIRDESQLQLLWWSNGAWRDAAQTCQPPSIYTRDVNNNVLSLPICHLSLFALYGPSRPLHLPLVLKGHKGGPPPTPTVPPETGIHGTVARSGGPASDLLLELRHSDGADWSTQASARTASDGGYQFSDVPALPAGHIYYVRYLNTPQNPNPGPGYLYSWSANRITSYAAGATLDGGDFEVADIPLVSPADEVRVTLPAEFCWERRNVPGDNYALVLYYLDGEESARTRYMGDVGCVTLTGLPSGWPAEADYAWWVQVAKGADPEATPYNYGSSYGDRLVRIRFSTAGPQSGGWVPLELERRRLR